MDGFSKFRTSDKSRKNKNNTANTSDPNFNPFQQPQFYPNPQYNQFQQPQFYPNPQYNQFPSQMQPGMPSPGFNSSSSQNTIPDFQQSPQSQGCEQVRRVDYNRFACPDDTEEDDDEDTVEETPLIRRGKGKLVASPRKIKPKQEKRVPWIADEEVALLEGWIDVSENATVGRGQDRDGFWKKVTAFFHQKMDRGEYRTPDGLYSKWGPMNSDLTKFIGILSKYTSARQSGWSEADIFTHSLNEYREVAGKNFKFTHLVEIARNHPKWSTIPSVGQPSAPKRSKTSDTTSSDTRTPVELDDDDVPEFSEPRRPEHGKKKASMLGKSARRSSSTSTTQSTKSEQLDMLNQKMENIASLRAEQNDFKILGKSLSGVTGEKRRVMKALQKRALERNRHLIPEYDEEDDEDDEE